MGFVTRTKYRNNDQVSAIIEVLDERELALTERLEKYMSREEVKLDKIIAGFSYLEKEIVALSAVVASNHAAAMSSITDKKHEIREEASEKYATKVELSNGLNSLRNTAKIVWAMVLATVAAAGFLSSKGIL